MNEEKRLTKLAEDAAHAKGSQAELARYLRVTRAAVNDWIHGRTKPDGLNVVKMQDLLKRAACVLLAAGLSMTGNDADAFNKTPARDTFCTVSPYTLCVMYPKTNQPPKAFRAAGAVA